MGFPGLNSYWLYLAQPIRGSFKQPRFVVIVTPPPSLQLSGVDPPRPSCRCNLCREVPLQYLYGSILLLQFVPVVHIAATVCPMFLDVARQRWKLILLKLYHSNCTYGWFEKTLNLAQQTNCYGICYIMKLCWNKQQLPLALLLSCDALQYHVWC